MLICKKKMLKLKKKKFAIFKVSLKIKKYKKYQSVIPPFFFLKTIHNQHIIDIFKTT